VTRHYSAAGEPIDPRDVLDAHELAQYEASRRHDYPSFRRPAAVGDQCDEYGYDRDGNWHPEHDGQW
jgi:hypothetical protein